jgi:hypothetical protein
MQGVSCRLDGYLTFHIAAAGLLCLAVCTLFPRNINAGSLQRIGILLTFGGLVALTYRDF